MSERAGVRMEEHGYMDDWGANTAFRGQQGGGHVLHVFFVEINMLLVVRDKHRQPVRHTDRCTVTVTVHLDIADVLEICKSYCRCSEGLNIRYCPTSQFFIRPDQADKDGALSHMPHSS